MTCRKPLKRGIWGRQPKPFIRDARRWRDFCQTTEARIEAVRMREAFDGRMESAPVFDPPIPAGLRVEERPVRLRLMAAPTLPRDPWTGRLMRRAASS